MQDKLVTIFGGGGFLGRYVAQELLARGARIRVAERDPGDAMHIRPLGDLGQTQLIAADITRPASVARAVQGADRSEEHTSELQSLMRISYAVFCLKKKQIHQQHIRT